MMDNKRNKRILWLLKALLFLVLVYGWGWGHWDIHNFMDDAVTAIGIAALLLVW